MRKFLIAIILATSVGCTPAVRETARVSLALTHRALTQTQEVFLTIDRDAQEKIIANNSISVGEAKQRIVDHRAARDQVVEALIAAYNAIAAADSTLALIDAEELTPGDAIVVLLEVRDRVEAVVAAFKAFRSAGK